ncbi:MAG TPA: four-helix bundle copper-binding protein [Oxalobacteraceae bacterium]|nr:four-helix bundle copper-binding protein [Oxalobacteraceae bacterium]
MAHEQFASCIEACNACANACDHCATACLQEPDSQAMARCVSLDMDCAQICRMAASYMARGSEFASTICQACAELCDACGDECAKFQMEHCQACAQACRRCADECRRMASGAPTVGKGQSSGMAAH